MEKMNFQEMDQVAGGQNVTREEYCATARMIINNGHTPADGVMQIIEGICSSVWE
jgi:hypothetical protein